MTLPASWRRPRPSVLRLRAWDRGSVIGAEPSTRGSGGIRQDATLRRGGTLQLGLERSVPPRERSVVIGAPSRRPRPTVRNRMLRFASRQSQLTSAAQMLEEGIRKGSLPFVLHARKSAARLAL